MVVLGLKKKPQLTHRMRTYLHKTMLWRTQTRMMSPSLLPRLGVAWLIATTMTAPSQPNDLFIEAKQRWKSYDSFFHQL
jgi:hypothetical protein